MAKRRNMEELFKAYEGDMQQYITTDSISRLSTNLIVMTDKINNTLSDEQQKLLQEILDLEHERCSLEEQQVFKYAFQLGAKLYKEVEEFGNY